MYDINSAFAKEIEGKIKRWKDSNGEIYPWTLTDAFWLMHLNLSIFKDYVSNPKNTTARSLLLDSENTVNEIKTQIIASYAETFERDYKNFIKKLLDDLFADMMATYQGACPIDEMQTANRELDKNDYTAPLYQRLASLLTRACW